MTVEENDFSNSIGKDYTQDYHYKFAVAMHVL